MLNFFIISYLGEIKISCSDELSTKKYYNLEASFDLGAIFEVKLEDDDLGNAPCSQVVLKNKI